jgi:hypothetical protein
MNFEMTILMEESHVCKHLGALETVRSHLGILRPICIKQDRALACTSQPGVVEPRGLPVADALPCPVGSDSQQLELD